MGSQILRSVYYAAIALTCAQITANVGCMDFRTHAYKCNEEGDICCNPFDYKQWHYVYCACPCESYPQRFKKGKCQNCWHYHEPKEIVVIGAADVRPPNP